MPFTLPARWGGVLAACLLLSSAAVGQNAGLPAPKRNIIKLAPLGWIHGQLPFSVESRLSYERVVGARSSVAAGYSYLGTNYPFNFISGAALSAAVTTALVASGHGQVAWTDVKTRTEGHRFQVQYKRYLTRRKPAPEGFYLSPHYSYTTATYRSEVKDLGIRFGIKTTNHNYNLLFGFQEVLGRHFVVDVFTGLGYRDKTEKTYDANGQYTGTADRKSPLKVSSGLNVGWAF